MTDYLPLPITDSPQNSQHPNGFIPKHFPDPLLEALSTLKARGIRVDLCSRTSVLDTRFNECNIVCGRDQIILPDDIPETCECIYVYNKSDRWMVSRVDPVYEKFTPLIFAKKSNRTSLDAMYVIDNGDATETELVYYNLRNDILNKLEELNLTDQFGWHYTESAEGCANKLALAINSLSYRRMREAYYNMIYCMDYCLNRYYDNFIYRYIPELEEWVAAEIIEVSTTRNRQIRGYKRKKKSDH